MIKRFVVFLAIIVLALTVHLSIVVNLSNPLVLNNQISTDYAYDNNQTHEEKRYRKVGFYEGKGTFLWRSNYYLSDIILLPKIIQASYVSGTKFRIGQKSNTLVNAPESDLWGFGLYLEDGGEERFWRTYYVPTVD